MLGELDLEAARRPQVVVTIGGLGRGQLTSLPLWGWPEPTAGRCVALRLPPTAAATAASATATATAAAATAAATTAATATASASATATANIISVQGVLYFPWL